MKRIIALALGALVLLSYPTIHRISSAHRRASTEYVRGQVLLLRGERGLCSGVAIVVKGMPYVLTAAHCRVLLTGSTLLGIEEDGTRHGLTLVKMDKDADLMLLSGLPMKGVAVADKDGEAHAETRVIGHGEGHMAYLSVGETLEESIVTLMDAEGEPVSILVEWTTAHVVGGCSGGPAVDASGSLIGITSLGNATFSGIVPLHVIKDFLRDVK